MKALETLVLRGAGSGIAVLFTLLISRYLVTDVAAEFLLLLNISIIAAVCFRWGMDEVIIRCLATIEKCEQEKLALRLIALSHRRVLTWAILIILTAIFLMLAGLPLAGLRTFDFMISIAAATLTAITACAARVYQAVGKTNLATFLLNVCIPLFSLTGLLFCIAIGFQLNATYLISIYAFVAVTAYIGVVWRNYGSPYALISIISRIMPSFEHRSEMRAANKLGFIVLAQQALLWGAFLIIPINYDDTTYKGFLVAQKIATLISLVMLAINFTFSARFAFLYNNNKFYELRKMVRYSVVALLASSALIFLAAIYFQGYVFSFAKVEQSMGTVLFLLLGSQVFFSLASIFSVVLSMCHDEKYLLTAQGSINVLGLLLLLVSSFVFSIEVTSITFIISYFFLSIALGLRLHFITSSGMS